jgi:predicted dehydrogenase
MIRIGIVGIGFMGMTHFRAYQKLRGAKVAAICDADARRREGDWRTIRGNFGAPGTVMDLGPIARYAEFEQMLADPRIDLVDICLPTPSHQSATLAALKAGKHVFCEKPIALDPASARKMVEAADRAGKLLLIGHVLPFLPEYDFAYRAIVGGRYGRLLGGHFKRIISEPSWMADYFEPDVIGGPMLDLHVHDAHFIRLICGMPRRVSTVGRMRGNVLERFSTQFVFGDPSLCVTAECGVIGQQGRPFTQSYEIQLERATLFFDYAALAGGRDAHTPLTVLTDDGKVSLPKLDGGDPSAAFAAELAEVVRAVRRNEPSPVLSGELACDAVRICRRETESALRGRPVAV